VKRKSAVLRDMDIEIMNLQSIVHLTSEEDMVKTLTPREYREEVRTCRSYKRLDRTEGRGKSSLVDLPNAGTRHRR